MIFKEIDSMRDVEVICHYYSIAEQIIREKLKESGETVLNQLGKPTQRPTLKWIFQKFRNIGRG